MKKIINIFYNFIFDFPLAVLGLGNIFSQLFLFLLFLLLLTLIVLLGLKFSLNPKILLKSLICIPLTNFFLFGRILEFKSFNFLIFVLKSY